MNKIPNVLVLNRSYIPVQITDWSEAMSNIYTGKARPMDRDLIPYTFEEWLEFSGSAFADYPKVHTVRWALAVPEIILLTMFDRLPMKHVQFSKPNCFLRDKYRCAYCGKQFPQKELTADHIIPKCRGGGVTWENIISSCFPCNQKKANRTPEEAGMKLKFHPKNPKWMNPLDRVNVTVHPCKSWQKFMDRIDTNYENANRGES